jgi:hypothetical protein
MGETNEHSRQLSLCIASAHQFVGNVVKPKDLRICQDKSGADTVQIGTHDQRWFSSTVIEDTGENNNLFLKVSYGFYTM